jgi:hypothetical protein
MTVNYKADAMLEVRKYLWTQLKALGIFDKTEYYSDATGLEIVPIIPVQQTAEFNQFLSGKKHIVYDKIGMSYEDMWAICCEQILFTIYATDISEINEIRNVMTDLFRRMDESGKDLTIYSDTHSRFKFYSILLADISPTSPSEEMSGFLSADVVLEIKYSRQINSAGRFI